MICFQLVKVSGAGLTIWKPGRLSPRLWLAEECRVTSGRAPDRVLIVCTAWEFRPIPVRRNFRAWDCKVTPANSSCQARNTTGCIPSNDGLDARFEPSFPHCGKYRADRELFNSPYLTAVAGVAVGSIHPSGALIIRFESFPRLTPWGAEFLRRFAADSGSGRMRPGPRCYINPKPELGRMRQDWGSF